jgi:hypothetical protein
VIPLSAGETGWNAIDMPLSRAAAEAGEKCGLALATNSEIVRSLMGDELDFISIWADEKEVIGT